MWSPLGLVPPCPACHLQQRLTNPSFLNEESSEDGVYGLTVPKQFTSCFRGKQMGIGNFIRRWRGRGSDDLNGPLTTKFVTVFWVNGLQIGVKDVNPATHPELATRQGQSDLGAIFEASDRLEGGDIIAYIYLIPSRPPTWPARDCGLGLARNSSGRLGQAG